MSEENENDDYSQQIPEQSTEAHHNRKIRVIKKKKKRKKKHLTLKIILGLLALIFLSISLFAGKVYLDVRNAVTEAQTSRFKTANTQLSKLNPISILVIGTTTANDKEIVATSLATSVNPKTKKTTVVNIDPSKVLPDGSSLLQTYQNGGATALQEKMQGLLGLTFNKVIVFNLDSLGDFTEITSGITVQNPQAFSANGYQFAQGSVHLTKAAEVKAYLILLNPSDVEAMSERRRNVAMAVFENIKKMPTLQNYQNLLATFATNVQTNLSLDDFIKLALDYRSALTLDKMNVHSSAATDGSATQLISQTELDSVKAQFLKTLN
ncbi:MAG: hypothetical protein LBI13_00760 [Streptococcaceae bacterium]|jgi:anionic cell wall polymer biosynthesis LytR-Cps2A-Psr (LCP) family protein|nr:hypothetical protein [Streptococcaceae bacterium]